MFEFSYDYEITSTQYSLLKLPTDNIYFIAFAQSSKIYIIKFLFNEPNFDSGGYYQIAPTTATSYNGNYQTISLFLMEDENILVLFYLKSQDIYDSENQYIYTYSNYSMIFYQANDDSMYPLNELEVPNEVDPVPGKHFFLKDFI